MRKLIYLVVILFAATIAMTSCRSVVENSIENIKEQVSIESIDKVNINGFTSIDLLTSVRNDSRHKLLLKSGELTLYYNKGVIGELTLKAPVELDKRTSKQLLSQWGLSLNNPFSLIAVGNKINKGDINNLFVSFSMSGRFGIYPLNLSEEMVPLSHFLAIFGIENDELKNILQL